MTPIVVNQKTGCLIYQSSVFVNEGSALEENPVYKDRVIHDNRPVSYRRQKFRDAKMEQMRQKRDAAAIGATP